MNNHPVTIDDVELLLSPETYTYDLTPAAKHWVGGTGKRRVQYAFGGAGMPDKRRTHVMTLQYSRLQEFEEFLDALLSKVGAVMVAPWRKVTMSWTGDGQRSEFLTPWDHAPYAQAPPTSNPIGEQHFEPVVTIGLPAEANTPLALVTKTAAEYDAGPPAAGEVWFDTDAYGRRFKLAEPLEKDAVIYARTVPRVLMNVAATQPRQVRLGTATLALAFTETD